jgi:hypothetical protein
MDKTDPVFMVFNKTGLILKTNQFRWNPNLVTVAKLFDQFLQFIDRFLPILKTATIPIFESMGHWGHQGSYPFDWQNSKRQNV